MFVISKLEGSLTSTYVSLTWPVCSYRAKYITCKNAGIRPFFHMGAVCMVLNYMIDYKFHLKYEKNSKYH